MRRRPTVGSLLDISVPGDHAFTITASDEFGNTSSSTASYRVVYQFSGFQGPVGDGLSAAQAGRTIPLTWTLTSATGPVTSPDAVSTVTAASVACDGEAGGELAPTDGVGTGLEYLADGTSVGTLFEFR